MRIVLRSDVDHLGKRGDIREVADGYARNYLLPKGHAIVAGTGLDGQATAMRRARDRRDARDREAAETVARQLVPEGHPHPGPRRRRGQAVRFGDRRPTWSRRCVEQTGIELDRRRLHLDGADPFPRVPRGAGQAARRRGVPDHHRRRPQLTRSVARRGRRPTTGALSRVWRNRHTRRRRLERMFRVWG